MEHDSFDDPIFGEFGGGPLNPLGAKPLMPTSTAMHPVMLGSVHELCNQQQQQQQLYASAMLQQHPLYLQHATSNNNGSSNSNN